MPIIFSDLFLELVRQKPLVYVDAGARGGLEGPWAKICDERLRVVAFEPDAAAARELSLSSGVRCDVLPKALWNVNGTVPVHLAKTLSTSSVHPPNSPVLRRYAARHGEPRETISVLQAPCSTLDSVLSQLEVSADFLKIDTQGSEYEILEGARRALRDDVFAVITETWTVEVHAGQRLTGDVMRLMHEAGFSLFDLSVAAAWQRAIVDEHPINGKAQITGLDLLFFREPSDFVASVADHTKRVKAAAIAELYGFPDVAAQILQSCLHVEPRAAALLDLVRTESTPPQAKKKDGLIARLFGARKAASTPPVKLHY